MKLRRHSKIIELINKYEIETQEELLEKLAAAGYKVTQATISRDVRELSIIKIASKTPGNEGKQVYVPIAMDDKSAMDRHIRVFKEGVSSIDYAQNIVVVKTFEGMAMAIAACLDGINLSEIIGCIAGDNTIMCLCKTDADAITLMNKLFEIIE